MRKIITVLVTLVVALFLWGGLTSQPGQAQITDTQGTPEAQVRTVTVSGTGRVSVQPDTAVVILGVQTEAEEPGAALSQNNERVNALLETLRQAGIPEKDIQTQSINLYPRYQERPNSEGQQEITGYVALNTLEVRVSDIDRLGEILNDVVQAGGNLIQNIRFEVSDRDQLLDEARQEAMNNARQKAEQLANLAGAQLGDALTISEGASSPPQPYAFGGANFAQEQAVPIEPGTQDVQATVQVTWLLQSSE